MPNWQRVESISGETVREIGILIALALIVGGIILETRKSMDDYTTHWLMTASAGAFLLIGGFTIRFFRTRNSRRRSR